jgi:hypothetical protein
MCTVFVSPLCATVCSTMCAVKLWAHGFIPGCVGHMGDGGGVNLVQTHKLLFEHI